MEQDKARTMELVNRIITWSRNAGYEHGGGARATATILSETPDAVDWLADPRSELVHRDTLVMVRESRRGRPLPRTPGTWLPVRGSLAEPGDEVELGDQFWLQVTDYASLRYLAITGPTIVRVYTTEDVAALAADIRAARSGGRLPEALLHPVVELGDRCALSGGLPCTAHGLGGRLYVDADRAVRTVPGGVVIGEVGDSARVLTGSAHALSAQGDVCVDRAVSAALRTVPPAELAGFLAGLDAARVMTARTRTPWRVSGFGFRVADAALRDEGCPPRTDLLVLSSDTDQVLFDARVMRGFRVGRGMAEILDVLLHSTGAERTVERLRHCANVPGDPVQTAADVRAELSRRGVELPVPALSGASR